MDFQGTYELVSVNGKRLPAAASTATAGAPIRSGSITLNYGGTVVDVLKSDGPDGKALIRESTGTWEVIPSGRIPGRFEQAPPLRIDLTWKDGSVTKSMLDIRTLTLERDGVKFAYRFARAATNNLQLV